MDRKKTIDMLQYKGDLKSDVSKPFLTLCIVKEVKIVKVSIFSESAPALDRLIGNCDSLVTIGLFH